MRPARVARSVKLFFGLLICELQLYSENGLTPGVILVTARVKAERREGGRGGGERAQGQRTMQRGGGCGEKDRNVGISVPT